MIQHVTDEPEHHIWDSNMPEQLVGGYALADAKSWATTLTTAIKSGTYKSAAAGWLDGIDVDDAEASALVWAKDTNKYVCSTVLPDGVSAVETGDLSGDYYDGSIDVIKEQIAKGELFLSRSERCCADLWFSWLSSGGLVGPDCYGRDGAGEG